MSCAFGWKWIGWKEMDEKAKAFSICYFTVWWYNEFDTNSSKMAKGKLNI